MAGSGGSHRGRWRRWAAAGVLGLAALGGAAVAEAWAWRDGLAAEGRALPGTVVAGADLSLADAAAVQRAAAVAAGEALDRPVTLVHGDRRWEVSARELGASTDVDAAVDEALAATTSAPVLRVAAARWLGRGFGFDRGVRVEVPGEAVAELVGDLARRIDREPRDARAVWREGQVRVRAARPGQRLDREEAAAAITAAVEGDGERVVLPLSPVDPGVPTELLEASLPDLEAVVHAALATTVTVRHGDREWEVGARDVGAVPHLWPAVEAALGRGAGAGEGDAAPAQVSSAAPSPEVPLRVPLPALEEVVAALAPEVERRPRDAEIDYSSGWVELVEEEPGVVVDRRAAREALRAAFASGEGSVDVPVRAVDAGRTVEDYHHVLLVRQDQRRLYLYVDGEIAREWPVAVGAPGSATPTGTFTVGHKRHMPTWYNPAPDGWGADMPEIIEPGPANPLGLRALNWNRGAADTLIRFHGTSDTGSIGRAASRGCVRLTNGDVVELYDLVAPGTTIVSTWG